MTRTRLVMLSLAVVFSCLGLRGAFVAMRGFAPETGIARLGPEVTRRADIVDRNGELLATSVTVYSLFADPRAIWNADDVVDGLLTVFPDLDRGRISAPMWQAILRSDRQCQP
ncbi:MAG: hypothetical protein AAGJ50_12390, partial [Pseudomonadota bacterium]